MFDGLMQKLSNLMSGEASAKAALNPKKASSNSGERKKNPALAGAGNKNNPNKDNKEQPTKEQAAIEAAAPVAEPDRAAEEMTTDGGGNKRIIFVGQVLTSPNGPLKIAPDSRGLCVLFDSGMWLVSESHKNSPLITSVAVSARRQGFRVNDPTYVTPDIIRQAYFYAERAVSSSKQDDNSVRRKINETLQKAKEFGANDIHIEASAGRTKVEFRVDGALRLWETWTQREGDQFLSSVYSHSSVQSGATANWLEPMAAMLVPQSGLDAIQFPDGILSVRCQWMPLADGGRYLDMRLQYDGLHIFGANFMAADVDQLGFLPEQMEAVRSLRNTPGGMRIITGPVNQGKTTTLRVMLNRRMAETNYQLNCLMIEDPPEGGVLGARQIGVAASAKDEMREKTFIEIMRSALRLDPDIVMLGETRDLTTANFLFRLALTGRQVYTTLHVYSAIAVPQRLRDLGLEPYLVYDHHLVKGMMCQRLMRQLCPHCRIPLKKAVADSPELDPLARRIRAALALLDAERDPKADELSDPLNRLREPDLSEVFFPNIEGCRHCFKGRVGRTIAAEVIETDMRLMALLSENRMEDARKYWLSPHGLNGITMAGHALYKIRKGEVAPQDAEFELGPLISDRGLKDVESLLGMGGSW